MNWFSKYTFNALIVIAIGAIGFTAYNKKKVQVAGENIPYEYSLKINDQTISSYRSPASKKISTVEKVKTKSWTDSTTSTESDKDEQTTTTNANSKNVIPPYSPSVVRSTVVTPELERQIENNPTEFNSDSSDDSGASTSSPSSATATESSGTVVTSGTVTTPTTPNLKFGPAGSSSSGSGSDSTVQSPALRGKITPLAGFISQNSSFSLVSAAYATNTCTNARVLLLDLTNMSILHNSAIKESTISEDTKFDFDPVALKLDLNTPTRYMLETKGCTTNYQRIISSFYKDQDLDHSTTLVSKIVNTRIAGVLSTVSTESLQKFYDKIQESNLLESNFDKVYEVLSNTDELKTNFQSTFKGGSVFELTEAAPDVNDVVMFSDLKELDTFNYSVDANHWNSQYQIAYEWKVDDVIMATTPTWNYIPSANSKPNQKITLIIGSKAAASSLVDRSLPFHEINISATVVDRSPATPPVLALNTASSNPSNTRAIVLELNTGTLSDGVYSNCASFTSLAITENNAVPVDSDFTLTCTTGPKQLINYNLTTPADGIFSIKLWSKDAANRVSATPVVLPVELDTTAPVIEYSDFLSGYISDEDSEFKWKLTERNSSASQFFNVQFYNGSAWSNLPAVNLTNGPHTGTEYATTFRLPNINTNAAKLKVTYTDTLGHTTAQESPTFDIQRPILGSNPLSLDMGQVNNKVLSNEFTLEFKNTGAAVTKLCGPVTLTGANASEFQIVHDNCNGHRIGATACTVGIKARPTQKGSRNASAVITCNNDSFTTPLTIDSLNNAPAVSTIAQSLPEDSNVTINFGSINDIDGDVLTYSIVGSPTHGAISACQIVGADYVCTYTPAANYAGNDTFTFKANDGAVDSTTASVNIMVLPIDDAPTLAGPQSISTNEDTPLTFGLLPGSDIENDTLSYIVVANPTYGTLSCIGGTSTSCTYTPNANYNGSDFFTYKVSDGTFFSSIETVSITVNTQNDAPVPASNQTFAATEDTALNFTINSGSDVDVPAQTLSYKVVTAPTKGTLSNCIVSGSYGTDLSCTYTPNANANGTDSFTYKVYDSVVDSITNATITFNIAAVNDAPTLAATQSISTNEDTVLNFSLTAGSDIEGSTLTYSIVSTPASGTLSCTGGSSQACTYTPALNYEGTTTFTYKVNDGALDSTTATVTVTINGINDLPVIGANQTVTTNEDTPAAFTINAASDVDLPAQTLAYRIVTNPTKGTLSGCIDNASYGTVRTCTYTPNANANGTDTFTYKTNDGLADSSGVATVTINITPVNDAPTLAATQSAATPEDTVLNFTLNPGSDVEGSSLTYVVVSTAANGTLSCSGGTSRNCTFTPALNFDGTTTFTYKVNDGSLDSNIATVTITVAGDNDAPVIGANQSLSTNEDTALALTINAATDVDIPAQTLGYKIITAPTKGTLSGCIDNASYGTDRTCTYTPNANVNGTDTFTYRVNDGLVDSSGIATITITINAVNDAPTLAATQSVSTNEDTPLTFNLTAGSDIEASPLTYIKVTNTTNGTITCTGGASQSCTYTPSANFNGTDSFTYKVNDGALDSTTSTVTITVNAVNDAPTLAATQAVSTAEDTVLNLTLTAGVDAEGSSLTYTKLTNTTNGTITCTGGTSRACTYTPNANFNGTDTFTYKVNDGALDSTTATVTITVTPVNDTPTLAASQAVSTNEDTVLNMTLTAGADIDADTLTYIKVTNTTNGTVTCSGGTSRACTYTPNANFNGTDSFTYKVNDGTVDSTTATVTITVNAVNDAPTLAATQAVSTAEDTVLNLTLTAGADTEGSTLSYIKLTDTTNGTITCTGGTSRACTYTPNANFNGTDTFTYKVNDGALDSTTATVTITVTAVNDAPTLAATQAVSTAEDTVLNMTLTAGADVDGNTLTYVKLTNTTNGTITCTGGTSRACTYTPNANFNGTDSFTYKVNDGTVDSTTNTVTITVTAVNDAPVMGSNQSFSVNDNTTLAITLNSATDIDGGALSYKIITAPANGTVTNCITTAAYGTDLICDYKSNVNFNGTDTFTFQAYDTFTTSAAVATVTITVSDKTPAPAPAIALSSAQYTKVTGTTFTASSCTDTPNLFVNEGAAPTAGAAGWQACSLTANAITYSLGATPTQGLHTLKVWAKDAYGNVSATSTDFSVYYDTVIPALALTTPPAQKGGATYNLAWTATESYTTTSLLFTVEATTDGTTWSTVGTTASTAGPLSSTAFTRSWTVPSVNVSTAKFRVTFTDRAGNANTVTSPAFTIDSTAPALTITAPTANAYFKTSATMTGACETGVNIYFTGNLQADFNIACTGGTYSQLVNFSDGDGNKTITVTQTDAVGNVTAVSRNFIRDEVAPILAKTTGKSPDFTKNNVPNTWSGTCEGNYTVSVSGSQTTTFACTAGTWSWTPASKTVDGTYSYDLVQTDGAGNVSSPPLTLAWTRDATAPAFTTTNPIAGSAGQTKTLTNNLSALTFNGTCEGTNAIAITGAATGALSCSSSSWSWTTPTVSTDGLRSYTFKQTDSAGNISTIIVDWTRDTTGPALTITTAQLKTNTNTVTFSGNCSNGYNVDVTGAQTATATCTSGAWTFTTASNATDATRSYTFKQTFTVSPFNSTTVTGSWIRKTTVPTVSAFTTSATNPSRSSYIPVNVTANSQSAAVYLSHLCIVSDSNTKPIGTDPCFVPINGPDIAKPLAQTLSLSNYSILMGWTPKTYDIYVWVKDEAGNISDLTAAGAGTLSTDKMNMSYDPGIPPTVWDVLAANIVNPPNPPTRAQTEVPAGSTVYIRWKATDNIALPAGAVSLSYTPDEINFTDITSGLSNANYGCTGVTLASNEGCYKWNGGSPLNTAYKIRVKVTDAGDVSSQLISNPLNSGLIKIIAGNTESGLGGSAQTAMFYTRRVSDYADPGSLVVTDSGQFFFADYKRGILTIDQSDGKQKIFIQATGASTGDGGPAVNATLKYANKLALDYQGRLLILDQDRIRRVDLSLSTPTIETIIGGGTDTADTVDDPLTVKIYAHSTGGGWDHNPVFFATPNGDIYFQSDYAIKNASTATYRLRVYKAATDQVISKYFTGTGDKYVPTQDLSKCRLMHPALAFDPNTSMLTGVSLTTNHELSYTGCDQLAERYSRSYFDPDTFVAITPKDESLRHYSYPSYTGMDGKNYIHAARTYINRVNMDGTYTRVLGSGTRGTCADGTAATACNIDVQNYFVSTSGKVYFTDRGVIRTVDESGNVKSLFGQNLIYGHGVAATNARFSDVGAVFRLANGKIITNDIAGEFIKEFSIEGNINTISGNGSTQNLVLTVDPTTNGMPDSDWMTVNRANGDVYASQTSMGYGIYAKLNRTTNRWENVVGATTATTHYSDADSVLGANILGTTSTAANRGLIVGFGNNELVISRMRQNLANSGRYEDMMYKTYDSADGFRQSHIAGVLGYPADSNVRRTCDATTAVLAATCEMPYWDTFFQFYWDSENTRWVTGLAGSGSTKRDVYEFTAAGMIKKIGTTASDMGAYVYVKLDGVENFYYCSSGRIRRYNLTTKTDLGALAWSMTNLNCKGKTMDFNPTNRSLIFPFEQNGLNGVAEYFLP